MTSWLTQRWAECSQPPQTWLTAREGDQWAALRSDKRRRDWLLGRWTAKRLVQAWLAQRQGVCLPLNAVEVRAASDGAPVVSYQRAGCDLPAPMISLSHAGLQGFCALSDAPARLGVDIERIEPRLPEFVDDYFTPAEVELLRQAPPATRDQHITAIWSAKEAALKALRTGLTVDARAVTARVLPATDGPRAWTACKVDLDARRLPQVPALRGWWRVMDGYVLALAVAGLEAVAPAEARIIGAGA